MDHTTARLRTMDQHGAAQDVSKDTGGVWDSAPSDARIAFAECCGGAGAGGAAWRWADACTETHVALSNILDSQVHSLGRLASRSLFSLFFVL